MEAPIRTIIYEDNSELREGMAALLRATPQIELAGAFPNCRDIAQELRVLRPNVVLMDIEMPEVDGIEGTAIAKKTLPEAQVLMLTVFEDEERLFAALRQGASGYLLKETPPWEIIDAIVDVHRGGSPMTGRIARKVLAFFREKEKNSGPQYNISPREYDILRCLVEGRSYKEVAAQLFISVETVRSHIRHIYEKMQVHSKTEAVLKTLREGLLD
jgi:DNA-binding NarL/FixJ family response regulator